MAKRFIETEMWQSERFLDAKTEDKLLAIYLFTNCNYIGIFKKSLRLVSFELGFTVTEEMILNAPLDIDKIDDRFWLYSFCSFQYGTLSENCKPHKKYISELGKEGLLEFVSKGYVKGIQRVSIPLKKKNKIKHKSKIEEKEQDKAPKNLREMMQEFKSKYPSELLNKFYDYWTEPNSTGKEKWQLEKTWDTKRRLSRWSNNNFNGTKTEKVAKPNTQATGVFAQ